jgi:acyl homoserine lactone synthase
MQHQIVTGSLRDPAFTRHYAAPMFRLRYRVFNDRLRWDVKCDGEFESDEFDDLHTLYLLAANEEGEPCGGWRLRPTTLPYMMADVPAFEPLLHGETAPRSPKVWEISRFAVDVERAGESAFGFNGVARDLIRSTIQFAVDNQIDQYVMVVSAAVERLLKHAGLSLHRYGPPVRIGRVLTVACRLDIDAQTRHAILGHELPAELKEAA